MRHLVKRIIFLICLGILTSIAIVCWDIYKDRSKTIRILRESPLYESWEFRGLRSAFSAVRAGDKLSVKRIRYGKDYMAIKVEKVDGQQGWLIYQGGSMELDIDI